MSDLFLIMFILSSARVLPQLQLVQAAELSASAERERREGDNVISYFCAKDRFVAMNMQPIEKCVLIQSVNARRMHQNWIPGSFCDQIAVSQPFRFRCNPYHGILQRDTTV